MFRQALKDNKAAETAALLNELSNDPEIHESIRPLISKLQALLAGSRDPGLADDPDLSVLDAAEIKLLVEELRRSDK